MTLIKSISGIRGTIGGQTGDTLNPLDIVKFTTAYATFIRKSGKGTSNKIIVGRDGRISGEMVKNVVCGTLMGMGYDVINIGYATTPTTELAVRMAGADGGIIITASHNPRMWNALKLLNNEGEFLTAADGAEVLDIAAKEDFDYADVDHLGHYSEDNTFDQQHIDSVLKLKLADIEAIKKRKFRVCVDTINSVGGIILPRLFDAIGVDYEILNGECTGDFAHNPDKVKASVGALRQYDGRLIIMFQPHGFSPMRFMGKEIIDSFCQTMDKNDILLMPEIYFAGGSVMRDISSEDLIKMAQENNKEAHYFASREGVKHFILSHANAGDRVVIMGARDNTLPDFCREILQGL